MEAKVSKWVFDRYQPADVTPEILCSLLVAKCIQATRHYRELDRQLDSLYKVLFWMVLSC